MTTAAAVPVDGDNSALVIGTQGAIFQVSGETNIAQTLGRAQREIEVAMTVAQRFPRNEALARQNLLNVIKASPRLAEKVTYNYPRGKKQNAVTGEWEENIISGPSTYLAREAARVWGHLRTETGIIFDEGDERQIRSMSWDMQSNVLWASEQFFKKLVQRNDWTVENGKRIKKVVWKTPDERDLRELSNKYSSIGERNCILKIIPAHFIDEAIEIASQVTKEDAAKNIVTVRAKLADAFESEGVTVLMLEEYLGCRLDQLPPTRVPELRGIYLAIHDGSATWDVYANKSGSPLPGEDTVPQMRELKDLAKKLKWNDAQLANELGRAANDGAKLLAMMTELVAKTSTPGSAPPPKAATTPPVAETSPVPGNAPTAASEGAVAPTQAQQPPAKTPPPAAKQQTKATQRNLGDPKDF